MSNDLPLFDAIPTELQRNHRAAEVLRIIGAHGPANPIKIAALTQRTGLKERAIKGIVSEARKRGVPICSRKEEPAGYWWPSTAAEIESTAEELRLQARNMFFTIGRMAGSDTMFNLMGQTRLELERMP